MKELHLQPPEPVRSLLPNPQELRWEWECYNLISGERDNYCKPKEPRLNVAFYYDGNDWDFDGEGIITVEDENGEAQFISVTYRHPLLAPYLDLLEENVLDYIDDNTEDDS